jgi:drug/metabolite transporter (DMT)-like permease
VKPLLIAGIVVAALGAFVLLKGLNYSSNRSVLRVGDVEASVQERRAIPPWVGIAAVAGGALMIGAGVMRRTARS